MKVAQQGEPGRDDGRRRVVTSDEASSTGRPQWAAAATKTPKGETDSSRLLSPDEVRARWALLTECADGVVMRIVSREQGRLVVAMQARETTGKGVAISQRELEVLRLTAKGRGIKEVASVLGVASSTVGSHLAAAMKKIGARNLAEVVVLFG
jgi:DNA-binding NarL/FixJ family response regulator